MATEPLPPLVGRLRGASGRYPLPWTHATVEVDGEVPVAWEQRKGCRVLLVAVPDLGEASETADAVDALAYTLAMVMDAAREEALKAARRLHEMQAERDQWKGEVEEMLGDGLDARLERLAKLQPGRKEGS